jgi:hypothetical protein
MGIVRDAVVDYVLFQNKVGQEEWEERYAHLPPRLHVSDLGHCPRKAMLSLTGVTETDLFDPYVLEVMRCGHVWEGQTYEALARSGKLSEQDLVYAEHWAGSIDFIYNGVIVEHKATSVYNYRGDKLPYIWHLLQLLGYAHLYKKMHKLLALPDTVLFYRSWASWMEVDVRDMGDSIAWEGLKNGKDVGGSVDISVTAEMVEFEAIMDSGKVPDRYEKPWTEDFTCCRVGRRKKLAWPRCVYFHECWKKEHPGSGPIEL